MISRLIGRALGMACAVVLSAGAATASAGQSEGPAKVRATEAGFVLTTPQGMTLYTSRFDEATPGKSKCNKHCIRYSHIKCHYREKGCYYD